ncbi:MAG TPA: hypothetical protein VHA54_08900 [Solirubrobacterales bacterium]|nr:hypothetical protein [Solirubrobacterales bacterium]
MAVGDGAGLAGAEDDVGVAHLAQLGEHRRLQRAEGAHDDAALGDRVGGRRLPDLAAKAPRHRLQGAGVENPPESLRQS